MKPVRLDKLITPRILAAYGELNEKYPITEAEVRTCLNPLVGFNELNETQKHWRRIAQTGMGPAVLIGAMARTAILYLVDIDDFDAALASADSEYPLDDLPPMPFPRIAIEAAQDWSLFATNDSVYQVDALFFNESEPGKRWNVMPYVGLKPGATADEVAGKPLTVMDAWEITPATVSTLALRFTSEEDEEELKTVRRKAVEAIHFITARGVSNAELAIPRGLRRSFNRRQRSISHPKVYFVHIRHFDDDQHEGRGDREFHCRWLVRGHWRHFEDGRRTWVRPYIKGPVGAPWRGRPVYVDA